VGCDARHVSVMARSGRGIVHPVYVAVSVVALSGSIGDPGGFSNNTNEEGDVDQIDIDDGGADQIDIDGGGADQIGDGEEVVGSGSIGAEKVGDPDGSNNDALLNRGAD
jgi:hypothetical protein